MEKGTTVSSKHSRLWTDERQKKQRLYREAIRDAFFVRHWKRAHIARVFHCSPHTVLLWTHHATQDCSLDSRGWPQGMRRAHTDATVQRIYSLHAELVSSPEQFFTGASAIDCEWRKRYTSEPPPLRTIGRMMRELGISAPRTTNRTKGASRYLHYPEHTIYHSLGGRVLEADFIGKKYLAGQPTPLHFISYSFKKSPCLRHYQRVEAETTAVFIAETKTFFQLFERPDYVKVDNCSATIGSLLHTRKISRAMHFLLRHHVIPIFAVPRRPFSQASVEGSNSMFARKFWNARTFTSRDDVDRQLDWFNDSIIDYHHYEPPSRRKRQVKFRPRIYFLRQVRSVESADSFGCVDVMNEEIYLPASYINYFVLAEWDLDKELLTVSLELENLLKTIHTQTFAVNS